MQLPEKSRLVALLLKVFGEQRLILWKDVVKPVHAVAGEGLDEVAPRLPAEAAYLLFVQGEAHPDWTNPMMGMTTDGIVGETIIGYAVPEPTTVALLLTGFLAWAGKRSGTYSGKRKNDK